MRIAFLAGGAAGMYCGSCLHDAALANAMRAQGDDFILIPAYTPLRLDDETPVERRIFFGAIDVYLQEKIPWWRAHGAAIGRMLGAPALLRGLSRLAAGTSPSSLGGLTVSILRGEEGNQRRSLRELAAWLRSEVRPDVVHLSNALFVGFAREIREAAGAPIVAGLQGEDLFLDGLVEPHRSEALGLLRERSADVDRFVSPSAYYAEVMARRAGIDPARIAVVRPGVRSNGDGAGPMAGAESGLEAAARPPVIGYLARISPEKGLHVLADAFRRLVASREFPGLRLRAAGYLGPRERRYAAAVRRSLANGDVRDEVEILGTIDGREKLAFLRSIDVLSVPTVHPEPKGLFVLEAFASGVPVVQPAHGSFPELVEPAGAGLLHAPGDPQDLAEKLATVLRDADLRRRLGEAARAAARDIFTPRRMAEGMREVYRGLPGRAAATAPLL
jgi:glycosyltransferase involved in cell wall biosynthesis